MPVRPFRVFSLDGGGMRGSNTATYAAQLSNIFAHRRAEESIDLGGALDHAEANRPIEIFCIGTCPMPAGAQTRLGDVHQGLAEWKFGGVAANLSVDAQEFAYDHMARKLTRHLKRECEIIRFPRDPVPAALMPYLELDDTRPEAIPALINQARTDAQTTNIKCSDPGSKEGRLVCSLFMEAPVRPTAQATAK